MKPGSEYAEQDASDAPTTWSPPPTAPDAGYVPPTPARARIGVIVLTALIVELLLIGAGANQWVTTKIVRHDSASFRQRLIQDSWLSFSWRFSPPTGLTSHWAAQVLLVACVLMFTAAFIWCLLRGPVTWGRAFIGSWLAVVGAAVLGGVVRGLIDPFGKFSLPHTDRVTRAVFGSSGPSQALIVAAVALGFVVAVITSIVAVATRRPAVAGYGRAAEPGPPAFADPAFPDYVAPAASGAGVSGAGAVRPWQDQQYRPPAGAPTTQLPTLPRRDPDQDSVDEPTTQLPAMAVPPHEAASASASDDSATTRFPRPPDDEELGHFER